PEAPGRLRPTMLEQNRRTPVHPLPAARDSCADASRERRYETPSRRCVLIPIVCHLKLAFASVPFLSSRGADAHCGAPENRDHQYLTWKTAIERPSGYSW